MVVAPATRSSQWAGLPTLADPRLPFAIVLLIYLVLGVTLLGFNRSPLQMGLLIATAALLDIALHRILRGAWLFPLSAAISGMSLAILVNFAHSIWLPLIPVVLAITSKYILTYRGKHLFNPSLFGIVASLALADGMISVSPAYQWGASPALLVVVFGAPLIFFIRRIRRAPLIVSFLLLYTLGLVLRGWLTRHHMPLPSTLLGSLSSPAFFLFAFYMLTDPATSPSSRRGQILLAAAIVLVELLLHRFQSLYTLYYAAFICTGLRFLTLHSLRLWHRRPGDALQFRWWTYGCAGLALVVVFSIVHAFKYRANSTGPGFELVRVDSADSGIEGKPGQVLQQIDPRLQPVGKWLLSVGDAVAAGDVDGDGLVDLFFTQPLKAPGYRATLYRNLGQFQFRPIPIADLALRSAEPDQYGLPAAALMFDPDNDSDTDLLVLMAFGHPLLYRNQMAEQGRLQFTLDADFPSTYGIGLSANALDMNRDGCLDLVIGNALNPYLPDYDQPTRFSPFNLPPASYIGDRRMYNFMHRSWHDANNGGANEFYLGDCRTFAPADAEGIGLSGQRWTLDIATGDLNDDGWADLYLANDFGPDQLLINQQGTRFKAQRGKFFGTIGRDTYKGMNATIADLDGNGHQDIYVSNVHQALQAEGSLLWRNEGNVSEHGADAFEDAATQLGILNEHRFGWGAAAGDLDRDGHLDLVQANGMVDDSYDRQRGAEEPCPDYWYWNQRIALTGPDIHGYADRWADLRGRCIFPNQPDRIYLRRGRYFVDLAEHSGFDHRGNSRGVALVDLDNDGDLDIIVTDQFNAPFLYRNEAQARGWIGLELVGDGRSCNRQALGSQVFVQQPRPQRREVQASNGFAAQGDPRLLFGLGDYQGSVELTIRWCGQYTQQLELDSNRYHRIEQAPLSQLDGVR